MKINETIKAANAREGAKVMTKQRTQTLEEAENC